MGLFLFVLFFIVIPILCKKDEHPHSNNMSTSDSNTIRVECPYCHDTVVINQEGNWKCDCGKVFVYRDSKVYKIEDLCPQKLIHLVKLLSFVSTSKEHCYVKYNEMLNELFNYIDLNNSQQAEACLYFNDTVPVPGFNTPDKILNELAKEFQDMDFRQTIINLMFQFALCDGKLNHTQEEILLNAKRILNISDQQYKNIKDKYIVDVTVYDEYYKILGCSQTVSNEELKAAYKKLMLKYHPDRYASTDLPQDVLDLITEKCKKINEAYEKLTEYRQNHKAHN